MPAHMRSAPAAEHVHGRAFPAFALREQELPFRRKAFAQYLPPSSDARSTNMRCYSRETYRGVGPRETATFEAIHCAGRGHESSNAAVGTALREHTTLSHQGRITQHIRRTWSKHTRPQMFKHAARSAELLEL